MRAKGARRAPVVNGDDALVGIVRLDDYVELLAEEFRQLARLMARVEKLEFELRQ